MDKIEKGKLFLVVYTISSHDAKFGITRNIQRFHQARSIIN